MFVDSKQKIVKKEINNQNIKYGFLNCQKNNSMFINLNSWVELKRNDVFIDYGKEFKKINKNIKKIIYNELINTEIDSLNFIVDLDIRKNGLIPGMKSYLSCEITLFKVSGYFTPDEKLDKLINKVIKKIIHSELIENEYFKFHSKK